MFETLISVFLCDVTGSVVDTRIKIKVYREETKLKNARF